MTFMAEAAKHRKFDPNIFLSTIDGGRKRSVKTRLQCPQTTAAAATCAICGKPILPKDLNVTEDAKPVHGECWLARVKEQQLQQY
jgi:hypothetical protein